jgi:hypothetical protein
MGLIVSNRLLRTLSSCGREALSFVCTGDGKVPIPEEALSLAWWPCSYEKR